MRKKKLDKEEMEKFRKLTAKGMAGKLVAINWSVFKLKLKVVYPKQAKEILKFIEDCEMDIDGIEE